MMRAPRRITSALLLLALAACIDDVAPGNDREAHLDPPPTPAPRAPAASLAAIDPGMLKPHTLTAADLAQLPLDVDGACAFHYTTVGAPVVAYAADSPATLKLNGTLIDLPPAGDRVWEDAGLRVEIRPHEAGADDRRRPADLVVRMAAAPDELGFHGLVDCGGRG